MAAADASTSSGYIDTWHAQAGRMRGTAITAGSRDTLTLPGGTAACFGGEKRGVYCTVPGEHGISGSDAIIRAVSRGRCTKYLARACRYNPLLARVAPKRGARRRRDAYRATVSDQRTSARRWLPLVYTERRDSGGCRRVGDQPRRWPRGGVCRRRRRERHAGRTGTTLRTPGWASRSRISCGRSAREPERLPYSLTTNDQLPTTN